MVKPKSLSARLLTYSYLLYVVEKGLVLLWGDDRMPEGAGVPSDSTHHL